MIDKYNADKFESIRAGNIQVKFIKFGYETEVINVLIEPGQIIRLTDLVVLKTNKIPIEYVAANGNIVEAKNSAPLKNVEVTFLLKNSTFRLQTKSDSKGLFTSAKLPKGEYTVFFEYPTHVANYITVNLAQSDTNLATVTMYKTKQITIKYSVTEKDKFPIFNKQSSNVVVLKTSGIRKGERTLGSGFNFIERKIAGDWYGQDSMPLVYFRQRDNSLGIHPGMKTGLSKLGKVTWDSVKDGTIYLYSNQQTGPFPFDVGDVFVFNIEDGKRYAKFQILKIEDREDIPQSLNKNK